MKEKLKYDGTSYKWGGILNDLKRFVKQQLDIEGNWSSSGVDTKPFRSINILKSLSIGMVLDHKSPLSKMTIMNGS